MFKHDPEMDGPMREHIVEEKKPFNPRGCTKSQAARFSL
jgi:hypothetical protein